MPDAVEDGVPFLSAKDLKDDGSLNFSEDVKLISREAFARLGAKITPKRGDIVYSRYGACLGKARLVETDQEFLVSYSCVIIRLRKDVADPKFFAYLLDSDLVLTDARLRTQGIAVPDLGNKMIAKFAVPVPPLDEQREIAAWLDEKVSGLRSLSDTIASAIRKVQELRGALISAAVTGQIDVRTYRPQEAAVLCQ
jgi:type I restriction enzyme S subunit